MNSGVPGYAETRKERTRVALRAAMLEILGEKPFDQIQILDLTGRATVGYATFFRHYSSTSDVLDEIAGDQIRELLEMTIPVFLHVDSAASVKALCEYIFERRSLWRILLTGGAAASVRGEFVRQACEWSRKVEGRKMAVPLELGTVCAAGSTLDALAWWLDHDASLPIDQIARFVNQLVTAPFIGGE
jgi:AcrR family transcriptional regulator